MIELIKSALGAVLGLVLDPCKYKLHRWSAWLDFDAKTMTDEEVMRLSKALKSLQAEGYPVTYGTKGSTRWCRRSDCRTFQVTVREEE